MRLLRRRRQGQAILETAIVGGFLVLLLLGAIGFGNILQASIRCEAAARDDARAATLGAPNEDVTTQVLNNLSKTGRAEDVIGAVAVGINPSDQSARVFNTDVTVEVWWNFQVPVPLFSLIVPERLLYARKTMTVTVGI